MGKSVIYWDNNPPDAVKISGEPGYSHMMIKVPNHSDRHLDFVSHGLEVHVKLTPQSVSIRSDDDVVVFTERTEDNVFEIAFKRSVCSLQHEHDELIDKLLGFFSGESPFNSEKSPLSYEDALQKDAGSGV